MAVRDVYSQNCDFTINVPQDITICEESSVLLDGSIIGNYLSFQWTGTNGYSNSNNLSPTVFVNQTTTFTLKALSDPSLNLIVNGDFSAGNGGFTTSYTYMPDLPGVQNELWNEGTYTVVSNPNFVHSNFSPCTDHGGGGDMMVVNGAASLQQVWCQTISVTPNTDYIFEAYATSVEPSSPAILQFAIDGVLLGSPFGLGGGTCNWQQFYATWNSGGSTNVQICITNQNTAASGNDFALDDIFFGELCRDEEDFTVTLSIFDLFPPTSPYLDCNNPVTELTVIPLPTISGYGYEWSTTNGTIATSPNLSEISVLTSGDYTVTVTNQDGCTITQQYEVTADFALPSLEVYGDLTLDCTQKSSVLTASADINVTNYTWTLPNYVQVFGPSITANAAGVYEVSAVGANGCIGTTMVTVTTENNNIDYTADSSGVLSCAVQAIDIFLDLQTNIDSIRWSGPSIISQNPTKDTLSVGASGFYVYELFLGIDCSVKDSVYIDVLPPSFSYVLEVPDTLSCITTQTEISIQNTADLSDIKWYFDNGLISTQNTATANNTGVYYSVLTDLNGCTKIDSILVNGDYSLPVFSVMADSIDCIDKLGQFFTSNVHQGTYLWEGNGFMSTDQNPEFSLEGNYTLTVTGTNGCTETATYYLPSSQNFPSISTDIMPITCDNPTGVLNIITTIPTVVQWVDQNGNTGVGNNILSSLSNTYTITATAANGCVAINAFSIPIDTLHPTLGVIPPALLTCSQTSAIPSIQNGQYDSFVWSSTVFIDSTNLTPTFRMPGSYMLTLRNRNGCATSQIFTITENKTKPSFSASAMDLSCKMPVTNLVLTGASDQNYTLIDNNVPIQHGYVISQPGTYAIRAINSLGCDSTISLEIKGNFDKPIIDPRPILINCNQSQVWASDRIIDPKLEYTWVTGQGMVNADSFLVSSAQNLKLVAINEYGCESEALVAITADFDKPNITINGEDVIKCTQTSTTLLTATDIQSPGIMWQVDGMTISTQPDITITLPGKYDVSITNPNNGCSDIRSIIITKQPNLEQIDMDVKQPLCFGDKGSIRYSAIVGGTAPYTALIDNNIILQHTNLSLNSGSHVLQVTDINGCTLTRNIMIDQVFDFQVNAGRDTIINLGTSYKIQAVSDVAWSALSEITWSPSQTLSCDDCPDPVANPEKDTEYTITIIDDNGCIREDKVWIRVKFEKGFTVPNIMNPESTSGNQKFTIFPVFESIDVIRSLSIYDRWGNKLFDAKDIPPGDPAFGWNGTFGGRALQPGVCVWVAEILYKDNTSEVVSGDVTIVK